MKTRRFLLVLFVWCTLPLIVPAVYSQQPNPGTTQRTTSKPALNRVTVSLTIGGGIPISKAALTEFWDGGVSGSVSFMVSVNRVVAFGVGMDAGVLLFSQPRFILTYPTVPLQARNTSFLNLYIAWRYTPFWKNRWAPFFGATVGAARYTGAEYKQIVNGVRVTYYEIPGMTRLSLGGIVGVDLNLSPRAALAVEARGTYVHKDPEAGLWLALNGGIRFIL